MLTIIRKYVVKWYNTNPLYPGMDCTEASISQHYWWNNWKDNICNQIKVCNNCQKNKKQNLKYAKLPTNETETTLQDRLLVDFIFPYKIISEGHEKNHNKRVHYDRPGNQVVWNHTIQNKQADTIEKLVWQIWLCRDPRPMIIKHDRGN